MFQVPAGSQRTIYWFRRDLRLADNVGLSAAARAGVVVPVFISTDPLPREWAHGAASRWWLHFSLAALADDLAARGSHLVIGVGPPATILLKIARETGAAAVYCERLYEPQALTEDAGIRSELSQSGIELRTFDGAMLTAPERVRSKEGRPFRVFTPYWRAAQRLVRSESPLPAPEQLAAPKAWPVSHELRDLDLLPHVDWASGLRESWQPGERGAHERLARFIGGGLAGYADRRDLPAEYGTSRLSPHLHFGEISVRALWHALVELRDRDGDVGARQIDAYLRQLGWREFAYHVLYHFPQTPGLALDSSMDRFRWEADAAQVERWRRGLTGFPIVDAGMRELWRTGWMHNRVRMVVASFLVKDLLCDWRVGAAWFWDTLVDADLANNTLGWQWAAGCGADAAPYFRVFNPVLQGRKFDPQGSYVARWVPELARLERRWLHAPWTAPAEALAKAGVVLGRDYPLPIVDHASARARALAAFAELRSERASV